MPYLYSSAIQTHRTGVPMLRAMFLEYPEDPTAWHLDMQYFLGDNLLIAPVFNAEGRAQYYLPKGDWYGILDGKLRSGGGYVTEEHDFFSLPVLLRPGSAVFRSVVQNLESVVYDWSKDVELLVNWVEGMKTTVEIADHEKLGFSKVTLNIEDSAEGVTINVFKGSFTGSVDVKLVNKSIMPLHEEAITSNSLRLKQGSSKITFKVK
jgi:alpha-D-xyloside xylohydrolase